MNSIYRKEDITRIIQKIECHLKETQDDILGYYREIKYARRTDEKYYEKECRDSLKTLYNTYCHLLNDYNFYQNKLQLAFY